MNPVLAVLVMTVSGSALIFLAWTFAGMVVRGNRKADEKLWGKRK